MATAEFGTGFVVTVPLIISVAAFVWLFQLIDGVMVPVYARWLRREIPGMGLVTLMVLVLLVEALATNVLGGRLFQRGEAYLLRLPVFRAVYSPVKQLVVAFSPDGQFGFSQVVLVDDPRRGLVFGFLTKRFVLDRGDGSEELVVVYVPTNYIYFGDIHIESSHVVLYPALSVEEGVQIFLTGGMALSPTLRASASSPSSSLSVSSVLWLSPARLLSPWAGVTGAVRRRRVPHRVPQAPAWRHGRRPTLARSLGPWGRARLTSATGPRRPTTSS